MPAIRRLIPQPEPPLTHTQDLSLSWLCLNQPATASSTLVKTLGAESVHPTADIAGCYQHTGDSLAKSSRPAGQSGTGSESAHKEPKPISLIVP